MAKFYNKVLPSITSNYFATALRIWHQRSTKKSRLLFWTDIKYESRKHKGSGTPEGLHHSLL